MNPTLHTQRCPCSHPGQSFSPHHTPTSRNGTLSRPVGARCDRTTAATHATQGDLDLAAVDLQQQQQQQHTAERSMAEQRRARLADALRSGLRVVIDCSYAQAAQAWAEQQQQSTQIWGNSTPQQDPTQPRLQQPQPIVENPAQQHAHPTPSPAAADPQQTGQQQAQRRLVTGSFIHKEVRSVAKQIEMAAAINKRSSQPVALTVTSYTGALAAFAGHMGAAAWPVNYHAEHLLELFPHDQLVLLSPDASEPLTTLDNSKVYVIGGIVDKTVQKGLTLQFAQQHSLPAYRLPIKEHAAQLGLDFPGAHTRPILTAADVVTALLEFGRSGDWVVALKAAVPSRKLRHKSLNSV